MGKAETLCGAMLWRLIPVWEDDVGLVVSRDVDSLPMHRDRKMIAAFEDTSDILHVIHDSESHSGPLMGGMLALKAPAVRAFLPARPPLDGDINWNAHGADQIWLNRHLWSRFGKSTFIHQRREDIRYPEASHTLLVEKQKTDLDKVVRHIGAGYDVEKGKIEAEKAIDPDMLEKIRRCEKP
jgi:hypothetical protein